VPSAPTARTQRSTHRPHPTLAPSYDRLRSCGATLSHYLELELKAALRVLAKG